VWLDDEPKLIDMAPTILAALQAGEHRARRALPPRHRREHRRLPARAGGAGRADPGMPTGEDTSTVSDTEADEMEEHLRGLGYLE
jgi:hypothetical protein